MSNAQGPYHFGASQINLLPGQIIVTSSSNKKRARFPGKTVCINGVLLIIVGVIAIVCNLAGLLLPDMADMSWIGHGFWVGVPYFMTGCLALFTVRRKRIGMIVGVLVFGVITCILTIGLFLFSFIGMLDDEGKWYRERRNTGGLALNALMLACALFGFAFCLVISICSCVGLCRDPKVANTGVSMAYQNGQIVSIPSNQQSFGTVEAQQASAPGMDSYRPPPYAENEKKEIPIPEMPPPYE